MINFPLQVQAAFMKNTNEYNCGPVALYNMCLLLNIEPPKWLRLKHNKIGTTIGQLSDDLVRMNISHLVKKGAPDRSKDSIFIILVEINPDDFCDHWALLHKGIIYNPGEDKIMVKINRKYKNLRISGYLHKITWHIEVLND